MGFSNGNGPQARRVALVTGAASGIGLAIAQRLARDGKQIVCVDLREGENLPGSFVEADLTTPQGNQAAVDAALDLQSSRRW